MNAEMYQEAKNKHDRALELIDAIYKRKTYLVDLRIRLKHEENLPYIKSFLSAPPEWYLNKLKQQ